MRRAPISTLFPYTTLFRSGTARVEGFQTPDRCAFVSALPAGRARLLDTPMHAVEGESSETTIHPKLFDGFRSIFCDERASPRWQPRWIRGNDLRHTANFT